MDSDESVADVRTMIHAFRVSQAIRVCAELGISDLLADGPRTAAELAAATAADEQSLRRLLRAVAALGLYQEDPSDTFANTDLGTTLRSDHPARLADIARNAGRPYFW